MHYNFFIFGDSISFGCYDSQGGWVQRLSNFLLGRDLKEGNGESRIYNLSISGNQIQDIQTRFKAEIESRLSPKRQNIIIYATGLNDSAFVHSKKDYWVPFDDFSSNIQRLIDALKQLAPIIIFLGLTPVNEKIVNPMPWDTDKSYHNNDVQEYDKVIQKICDKNKIFFIPVYNNFLKHDYESFLYDGAHPNSAGHQMIFEIVRDFLAENEII